MIQAIAIGQPGRIADGAGTLSVRGMSGMVRYRILLAIVAVAAFFTDLTLYLYDHDIVDVQPRLWIALFGLAASPLLLAWPVSERPCLSPLLIWCWLFLVVSLVWSFPSPTDVQWAEIQIRFLSVVFVVIMLIILADRRAQHAAQVAIACAVFLAIGLNLYEVFNPETFSFVPGRSAGLYVNPNRSGSAIILGSILCLQIIPARFRIPFLLASGIGVLATFSRAAMIAWFVVVVLAGLSSGLRLSMVPAAFFRLGLIAVVAVGLMFTPILTELETTLEDRGTLNAEVQRRLAFIGTGSIDDDSAATRQQVAQWSWEAIGERPMLGTGTGIATQPPFDTEGPHNTYLALMIDHGVLGGLLLPLLVVMTTWRSTRETRRLSLLFAAFVLIWGLFSHTMLSQRYFLFGFALTASIVWSGWLALPSADRPVR